MGHKIARCVLRQIHCKSAFTMSENGSNIDYVDYVMPYPHPQLYIATAWLWQCTVQLLSIWSKLYYHYFQDMTMSQFSYCTYKCALFQEEQLLQPTVRCPTWVH